MAKGSHEQRAALEARITARVPARTGCRATPQAVRQRDASIRERAAQAAPHPPAPTEAARRSEERRPGRRLRRALSASTSPSRDKRRRTRELPGIAEGTLLGLATDAATGAGPPDSATLGATTDRSPGPELAHHGRLQEDDRADATRADDDQGSSSSYYSSATSEAERREGPGAPGTAARDILGTAQRG